MSEITINTKHPTANKLLIIAWAIEIMAALVSMLIGGFLIFGDTDLSAKELLQRGALISGIMFVVLAVVELSRIPLIISIYRAKKIWWKFVGTIFLTIIMFVTFESMMVGFEINTSFMTIKQKTLMNQIEDNNQKVLNINNSIDDLSNLNEDTIRENFKKDLDNIRLLNDDKINKINERIEQSSKDRDKRLESNNERILNLNSQRDTILQPLLDEKELLESKSNSQIQQNIRDKIKNLQERLNNIEVDKRAEKDTAEKNYKNQLLNLDQNYETKENSLRETINFKNEQKIQDTADLEKKINSINESKGYGKGKQRNIAIKESSDRQKLLDDEIRILDKQLTSLADEKAKEQDNINSKYENKLSNIDSNYIKKEKEIIAEIDEQNNELENRISIDQNTVKSDLDATNEEIKQIREQYELEKQKVNEDRIEIEELYNNEISKYNIQIENINSTFDEDKKKLDTDRDGSIQNLTIQNDNINELLSEKKLIIESNSSIKNEYNDLSTKSILHQFALKIPVWLYESCGIVGEDGKIYPSQTPADITPDCLDFTETIWFGSLALVIAITGTAVALGSEVLRTTHPVKKRSNVSKNILRILKFLRRPRIKKIVETKIVKKTDIVVKKIPKEIVVEKIVPTDVIKEKIVKQAIHVPYYTNDPALLNLSHTDDKEKKNK